MSFSFSRSISNHNVSSNSPIVFGAYQPYSPPVTIQAPITLSSVSPWASIASPPPSEGNPTNHFVSTDVNPRRLFADNRRSSLVFATGAMRDLVSVTKSQVSFAEQSGIRGDDQQSYDSSNNVEDKNVDSHHYDRSYAVDIDSLSNSTDYQADSDQFSCDSDSSSDHAGAVDTPGQVDLSFITQEEADDDDEHGEPPHDDVYSFGQTLQSFSLFPKHAPLCKFALYETSTHIYILGRDRSRTRFKLLKIVRSDACIATPQPISSSIDVKSSIITEDPTEYDANECSTLLATINAGNAKVGGLVARGTTFGIIGIVRFMLGIPYLVLITKRKRVGMIGGHAVYQVAETAFVQIPHQNVVAEYLWKFFRDDIRVEERYKALFLGVNLTQDMFFSYTYTLAQSLQLNVAGPASRWNSSANTVPEAVEAVAAASLAAQTVGSREGGLMYQKILERQRHGRINIRDGDMYVWNAFLLRELGGCGAVVGADELDRGCSEFGVRLVCGFFQQTTVVAPGGRALTLIVLSRRSRHFAGTRYLKRGINQNGYVANHVETEQILSSASVSISGSSLITSFVQCRGSIPLFWGHSSLTSPKPDILVSRHDPFYIPCSMHFEDLDARYGGCVVLNLVRKVEPPEQRRETILGEEFRLAVKMINASSFLRSPVVYTAIDFKALSKRRAPFGSTFDIMADLSEQLVNRTGFLHYRPRRRRLPPLYRDIACDDELNCHLGEQEATRDEVEYLQRGVVRTNCIDCLDRTNVAQFCISKCALIKQLIALREAAEDSMEPNSDIFKKLMDMYESMGNCLAEQYGGSNAHNKAFWKSRGEWYATRQSKELVTTVKRYYSNAFTDSDKQSAINLFMGIFIPRMGFPHLWEIENDSYLHSNATVGLSSSNYSDVKNQEKSISDISSHDPWYDFDLLYRSDDLTSFDSLLALPFTKEHQVTLNRLVSLSESRNQSFAAVYPDRRSPGLIVDHYENDLTRGISLTSKQKECQESEYIPTDLPLSDSPAMREELRRVMSSPPDPLYEAYVHFNDSARCGFAEQEGVRNIQRRRFYASMKLRDQDLSYHRALRQKMIANEKAQNAAGCLGPGGESGSLEHLSVPKLWSNSEELNKCRANIITSQCGLSNTLTKPEFNLSTKLSYPELFSAGGSGIPSLSYVTDKALEEWRHLGETTFDNFENILSKVGLSSLPPPLGYTYF